MTTIVSLAARDFIVVGCDSLATTNHWLAYPNEIATSYFDANGNLKVDASGSPLLKHSNQIWEHAKLRPVNQLPSVTKLFDLSPIKAALLFSGASRIGQITIRSLVEGFLDSAEVKKEKKNYTMEWVANAIKDFILKVYDAEIKDISLRPAMSLILSGYSQKHDEPEIWMIDFEYVPYKSTFDVDARNQIKRGDYNVIFGGQYDAIQRIVNGMDTQSYWSLRSRTVAVLERYHDEIVTQVQAANPGIVLNKPNFTDDKFSIFGNDQGGISALYPDCGSLSAQAGIDFVYFLIQLMIRSQEFSSSIATVGGKIHVALLRKSTKFHWISKESFSFENEHVPIIPNA